MGDQTLMRDYRGLAPAEYTLVSDHVVERAKALRAEFLRGLFTSVLSWRRRRSAIAQLNALDDVTLKDIGLHRSGIEAAVVNSLPVQKPVKWRAFPEKPHLCLQRTG